MEKPILSASRWRIGDTLFVEYLEDDGIMIDVGPFPSRPDDAQTEQAIDFLAKAGLAGLELGDYSWTLDLDQLTSALPDLKPLNLHGILTHPAAIEEVNLSAPRRFVATMGYIPDFIYLRISFEFHPQADETPDFGDTSEHRD